MTPILFAGMLLLLSLALPQQITTKEELTNVHFGLPFWFIEQDITAVTYTLPAPVWIGFPQENPTTVDWERFAASWAVLALVLGVIRYAIFGSRPAFSA